MNANYNYVPIQQTGPGNVIRDVGSTIIGVNIVSWFIIPAFITGLFVLYIIVFVVEMDFSTPIKSTSCEMYPDPQYTGPKYDRRGRDIRPMLSRNCRPVEYSPFWKKLIAFAISATVGLAVGSQTYKLGLAYYNPKAATAVVGTSIAKNLIFD